MRLHNLFESKTSSEQKVVLEFGDITLSTRLVSLNEDSMTVEIVDTDQQHIQEASEIINEFIPLAIGAVSLGLSAYDAYRAYKDYKAGNITGADLAKQVGTDAALNLIGGGIAKGAQLAGRGIRAGFNALRRGGQTATRAADTTADVAAAARRQAQPQPARAAARDVEPPKNTTNTTRRTRRRGSFDYDSPSNFGSTDLRGAVARAATFDSVYTLPVNSAFTLNESDSVWTYKAW